MPKLLVAAMLLTAAAVAKAYAVFESNNWTGQSMFITAGALVLSGVVLVTTKARRQSLNRVALLALAQALVSMLFYSLISSDLDVVAFVLSVAAVAALVSVVPQESGYQEEQYFNCMLVTGIKIRTGLVGAIYKKALRLSPSAKQEFNQGYIQTLQAVDAEAINLLPHQIYNGMYKAFVTLIVVFYLLYQQIGHAFLPDFLIVLLSSPIQLQFINRSGIMAGKKLQAMDKRIRLMRQTLIQSCQRIQKNRIRLSTSLDPLCNNP
ncbi:UNVERIFIED_CONTAM: hypothetical protein HDU68_002867 [Siphonaria sp. JEL0065]|nr:hypothetical protein HDU68_002867 [Siphonaria sp. JEL0065]